VQRVKPFVAMLAMHLGDARAGLHSFLSLPPKAALEQKEVIVTLIEVDSYIAWETYIKDIAREIHRTHSYSHLSEHLVPGIASIVSIYSLMLTIRL
jgi:hypothetical protein